MYALSPETLIKAYALGVFPMAEHHDDERVFFVDPEKRGILPLDEVHLPRRLIKKVRQKPYLITVNRAFDQVIDGCREIAPGREESWINPQIRQLYCALNRLGFAHSIEAWDGEELVGGLYGVALAGAFFGESMFSRATDASKITLVHLMARLKAGGFVLLDTQFSNPHLTQFGVIEVPRKDFKALLSQALATEARFPVDDDDSDMVQSFIQARTLTS
jgi:leucyl/phenylalanyl-tRNA--protein transferase